MEASAQYTAPPSFANMALGDGTPKKAFYTALVVGSILTIINHGDLLISGAPLPTIKILLTYCVPYCVTIWGAMTGKRSQWLRDNKKSRKQWSEADV